MCDLDGLRFIPVITENVYLRQNPIIHKERKRCIEVSVK